MVALPASEYLGEDTLPTFGSRDPRAIGPRRVVPDVLVVAAFELGNPVILFTLMKADDSLIHGVRGA